MNNLTEEQKRAVIEENENIIVSAGAGSGKTTVLKTRVLNKLTNGVKINELIILTFTNNAAGEMLERIRKEISKSNDENIKKQEELLDSAYITTFDSFAQSLVKKYHYILNISPNFSIVDENIINIEIDNIIDEIFENLYKINDLKFTKLIQEMEIKDDKNIRQAIKKYYQKLENIIDIDRYLNNYISNQFNKSFIEELFDKFENHIFNLIDTYISLINELNDYTISEKALNNNNHLIESLQSISSYDELLTFKDISIARANKNVYEEDSKWLREKIKKYREEIYNYLIEDKKKEIDKYLLTKDYQEIIINILKNLHNKLELFKKENNAYTFSDIAKLAVKLVKENENIRNEIKYSTHEIMIDEYQDTSDIQEEFISYIANNNVYMVGDVKQSIYRFRNANPYIFKNKYDNYSNNNGGIKIDLNKNFRSRNEVVDDVNLIFNEIMYDDIGGSDYKNMHQMVFGNTSYNNFQNNKNYHMEILAYTDEEKKYNKSEIEAFIIAKDIINRINNKEQVTYFENGLMKSRNIEFKDFAILIDKTKNFELLKQVLEYHNIPTTIYKDISIKDEDEIYILKNIIGLILKIHNKIIDNDFIHYFLSVGRSYVAKIDDNSLFKIVINKTFESTDLYQKCLNISKNIDSLSNQEILKIIILEFDIFNKLNSVDNIDERLTKLEYFINDAKSLNSIGLDINKLNDYFNELLNSSDDIKMSLNKSSSNNSVKIMTIYGSKGLEYPYIYLPYLDRNFLKTPDNSSFKFDNELGIITPFYSDGIGLSFVSKLNNINETKENISERIRLFYVGLTRAKEKIILVNSFNQDEENYSINKEDLSYVKSYKDILDLLKFKLNNYIKTINIDDLNITNEYNLSKNNNYINKINKSAKPYVIKNINLDYKVLSNKHFSKSLNKVIDKDFKKTLDFGTFMHYVFEVYDFNKDNIDNLLISEEYKNCIRNFLRHEEVKNISKSITYKEHEILFEKDGSLYHGFIDLLVEYEDHFDIIDYKLSNIDSEEYKIQLSGYQEYIEQTYKKPCNIYLYSIKKDIFKKLN